MKAIAASILILLGTAGISAVAQAADNGSPASAVSATSAPTTAGAAPAAAAKLTVKPQAGPRLEMGKPRSQSRDLRHCLDLPSNAEIAKCAGE